METPCTAPGTAAVGSSATTAAVRGVVTGTTSGAGQRERRTAPAPRSVLDAFASSGPAAPADRFLGLRHSG